MRWIRNASFTRSLALRVGGGINFVLLLFNQLARHAALGVFPHDVINHVARFLRDRRFRQIKIHRVQQRADELAANRPWPANISIRFPDRGARRRGAFPDSPRRIFSPTRRPPAAKPFPSPRRLRLQTRPFCPASSFVTKSAGKSTFTVRLSPAFAPMSWSAKPGMNAVRRGVHPEIFLLRQPLRRRRGFGDRLAVARAGVIHHRDVAGLQLARDRLKLRVLLRQQIQARGPRPRP